MTKLKLKISGVGVAPASGAAGAYSGPPLVAGSYVVRLKRMTHTEIGAASKYAGADRFNCLFEVCGPESASQYFGAPIWDGVNVIDPSLQFVNQFLHALARATTPAQQRAIEKAFYEGDLNTKTMPKKNGDDEVHVLSIGNKVKVNSPSGGVVLRVVVKLDPKRNNEPKVVSYIPFEGDDTPTNGSAVEEDEILGDTTVLDGGGELGGTVVVEDDGMEDLDIGGEPPF